MIDIESNFSEIASDLGINCSAIKGQTVPVRNCWHFFTSGSSVDVLFKNEEDFRNGMNRIMSVVMRYNVLIIAFVLMDTHVHFILYGKYDDCSHFVHEYIRMTSMYLSSKYSERNALKRIGIDCQFISDDRYLKTAICYVVKNPIAAGLPYNSWDYPWSSGSLYFRRFGEWTSPVWSLVHSGQRYTKREIKKKFRTHCELRKTITMNGDMIFPGEYTAVDIAEKIFRTHRAFNFFMCVSRDVDVEAREGMVSSLTIPINELREYRKQLSMELFGNMDLRSLNVSQRLRLAKTMKGRYNSSSKQIARVCGLVYDEVRDVLG